MRKTRKSVIIDFQRTFLTDSGETVLKELRRTFPLLDASLDLHKAEHIDVTKWAIAEGQRTVLLHIYKMLKKDPYAEREEHAIKGE